MWELGHKESWMLKNWCFWTMVLEKTLGSPLDCEEIQPVHSKGDQPWVFIGRTDAEAPILWPPDVKNWLTDPGQYWRQEEKEMTEDEMVGWHHQLSGHGFELAPGVGDGQESLVCCSPWCHKESDNWATELNRHWVKDEPLRYSGFLSHHPWVALGWTFYHCHDPVLTPK